MASLKFRMVAQRESCEEKLVGFYPTMALAETKVLEIDRDADHEFAFLEGYDLVLEEIGTTRCWVYVDGWEVL